MKTSKLFVLKLILLLSFSVDAAEQIEVQALMPGMVVLLVDGERITLKKGNESNNIKLVSSTTKIAVLEVDGVQKEFQMGTTVNTSFSQRAQITEQIISDKRGMFRSYGNINGQSVTFLVDTGASLVAMSAKDARKLGIQYHLQGKETRANTASGIAKAWSVKLKTVRLGQLVERNVDGMVVDGDYPTEVLLGMSFLNRMKVEKEGTLMKITRKK